MAATRTDVENTPAPAPPPLAGEGAGGRGPDLRALWGPALGLGTLLAVLLLWEIASRARILNPQFFPPVTDILGTFIALWRNNVFPQHLAATLARMAIGFGIAALLGI